MAGRKPISREITDNPIPERKRGKGFAHLAKTYVAGQKVMYNPGYIERLLQWFSVDYTSQTGEFITATGKKVKSREGTDFPSFEGFCAAYGMSCHTFYRWQNQTMPDPDNADHDVLMYPHFKAATDICRQIQKDLLTNNGLKGHYDKSITQLILSSQHDVVPKTAKDINMQGVISINIDKDDDDL